MKRIAFLAAAILLLTGCGANADSSIIEKDESAVQSSITETSTTVTEKETAKATETVSEEISKDTSDTDESTEISTESISESEDSEIPENEAKLQIEVNGHTLTATLADNDSAKALAELMKDEPLTLELREYGSFEKVGPLPQSLPANDESVTTEPGDIMLYQGNQITIFYGSNTWSYTRLGKIDNVTQSELKGIFGEGDVTVTFSLTK